MEDFREETKLTTEQQATPVTSTDKIEPAKAVTEASSSFHKNLMESVIYATSTSTEISQETEICYRGRCISTSKHKHK